MTTKVELESIIFERFQRLSDFEFHHYDILHLKDGEDPPDFKLIHKKTKEIIGIELTQCFISNGKEQFSYFDKIIKNLRSHFAKTQFGNTSISVQFHRSEKRTLVNENELIELIENNLTNGFIGSLSNPTTGVYNLSFVETKGKISIINRWIENVSNYNQDFFLERLQDKTTKLSEWKQKTDERWLILSLGVSFESTIPILDRIILPNILTDKWDRIELMDFDEIHTLKRL